MNSKVALITGVTGQDGAYLAELLLEKGYVVRGLKRHFMHLGKQERLYLGNLEAQRDWGHARDYVRGMWQMLQQEVSDDYVPATGVTTTVRQFVEWVFAEVGIELEWRGQGVGEKGHDGRTGASLVEVDQRYLRPTEVDLLLRDASKARQQLGWSAEVPVRDLVREMVREDLVGMQTDNVGVDA